MDDIELKDRQAAERATQAKQLLEHPLLKEAFDNLEKSYIDAMLATGVEQADSYKRDRLHQAVHISRKVRDYLKKVLANGNVSRQHLNAIQGKRPEAA